MMKNQTMKMHQTLKVNQNGNSKKRISIGKDGIVRILSPVTAYEIQLVEKEKEGKDILLMDPFPRRYRRFHGNGMCKRYLGACRYQEAHGAEISTEDANHKFLRSLPPRTWVKSGLTAALRTCTPSTSSTNIPEKEVLVGFANEVIYSLFAKQSEDWDLLHKDLEQINDLDIEEMDINWQIAMIVIRMKKFYKKTGRRVRVDGKTPIGFDKKKLECFNCHNTGHFSRECTAKGTNDGKKKRGSFYQHQEAGKQEKNQMGLLTMDDGIVNWGEHTEVEETNHTLMAISSSNEVSLCSKTCIDSYNTLKTLCDEQMNQIGDQEAQILAYSQAVKKLEAQLVTFQKQQLSLNEKLTFQANEIYEKDEKLKGYRRIGMKSCKGIYWNFLRQSVDPESEISSVPLEVYVSTPININEKGVSDPKSKEVEPSCVSHIKTPRQPIKDQATPKDNLLINGMIEVYFDSGISGLMTGNMDPLEDFEEILCGDLLLWRTLIEAARTMLADSLLPTTFWAEAVSIACYIFNRNTEEKVKSRTSSTNSKKEEILIEPQQEKKVSSTNTSEDNPKIIAFRRELEEIALKHLGTVSENNSTHLEIFHKSKTGIFDEASYDEEGVVIDFNSLPTEIEVRPTPTLRIHNIHPKSQILGDPKSAVQTRSKVQQKSVAHALISYIQKQQRNNHKDQQHCLFACFLSQEEPKKISEALQDDSWVQAMQDELLQFKLQ
ncbi:ribonuclease H-like domain-containing protein [Tanacetum coccineum]|uniref:Ribonuclease H-like domain-containing protein n=1 Tax=Tanacetum coccineum TaxID=301880 RepID=A0ABQ5FLA2_9ASTR